MIIYIILLLVTSTIFAEEIRKGQNDTQTELKKLEEERKKIFDEINKAIDESVSALRITNDTDAAQGINYIKDLKEQIKLLNNTNDLSNITNYGNMLFRRKADDKEQETKGKHKKHHKTNEDKRRQLQVVHSKKDDDLYNLDKIFGKKTDPKYNERLLNRIAMQQKLDQWLEERQKEKEAIKKYKLLQKQKFHIEECPREGVKSKKSVMDKKKYKKKKKKKSSSKSEYSGTRPCCRKCCKRSYMGCLRRRR